MRQAKKEDMCVQWKGRDKRLLVISFLDVPVGKQFATPQFLSTF